MFTPAQLEALQAAIDVAFDGTPAEETDRLEMERQAKVAFAKIRELTDTPAPSSKRCRMVTGSTKGPNILLAVKSVMATDPAHKVVIQPEVDYLRLWVQVNRLEAQYKEMFRKLQAAEDEIEDLKYVEVAYADTEPKVEPMAPGSAAPGPFHTHLITCERCRNDPFHLCPVGAILLRKEATNA